MTEELQNTGNEQTEQTDDSRSVPLTGRMRRQFFRRRRSCPFSSPNAPKIDYKNIQLLQKFLSDTGKILPSRITAVSTKHQRHLSMAVKRARFLALIPYIAE